MLRLVHLHRRPKSSIRTFATSMAKRKRNVLEEETIYVHPSTVTKKSKVVESEVVDNIPGESDNIELSAFRNRVSSSWKVGAHVSAAGGVENSVLNAAKIGANAFALFLKSQRKWTSPPLKESSVLTFKSRMNEFGYSPRHVLPHGSYLINLGNPDFEKREKSYECFLDDLKRCEELGLELYNFHPGSTVGLVPPSESMSFIAECINRAHRDTKGSKVVVVLENMAGSGNVIGSDFAHLGEIIQQVEDKARVGVCLDTCHMFAAGYDIRTKDGWDSTGKRTFLKFRTQLILNPDQNSQCFPQFHDKVSQFETHVGLKYLCGMHLNDSKTTLASKKDRHENIGVGHLSLRSFAHILRDSRVQGIPLILETPSHEGKNQNWSVWEKEIEVLNALSRKAEVMRTGEDLAGVDTGMNEEAEYNELTVKIQQVIRVAGGEGGSRKAVKRGGKARPSMGKIGKKKGQEEEDHSEDDEM
ncbi:hypothetical protein GYMLUDRAFT_627566 [Collybiopsis luxurians FD-317 M1]|nr:hypothetical protein GYMLUDRAFT_627566 [Collybiopsis luxurians FD-317 M1]